MLLSSGLRRHYTQVVVTITARVSNNGIHLSDSFFSIALIFFLTFTIIVVAYVNIVMLMLISILRAILSAKIMVVFL